MHSVHLKWQLLIALLLPLVGLFGCSEDSPEGDFKIVLRLSHVFSPKEELAIALESVAERVLEKTDGAVKILTYPQGQIAAYKDGVEMVVRGAYFISVEDPSYIGDYMPEFTALVGPMLYRNFEEYTGLVETPLVRGWVKELEEKGIKVLSLKYIFGFRNLITDREIRRPEDLAGLKLRTPGSKLFIETINAMGATATPLPWGETFSAIQQGVVDGLEGSDFTNIDTKVYETGKKRVALTNHFLGTAGVYISTKVWAKIPHRYQRIIEQEITEEADRMIERLNVKHRDVVKALEAQGVQFNEIDRPAFEQRTVGVFETMPGVTMAMYHRIQDELSRIRQDQQQGAAND
ncbi:MAG: C4-dicarboxylate ABC transporter substrate-binding protein [Haliea sp.]|jgi:TRAP-type C4-dicarboxylate transport system substrate-binding protein|nr:C4-dicarboxylate ABC transporter substrate-binding protein [Haliea sp.]